MKLAAKFHLDLRSGLPSNADEAIGELADYRMELFLATGRVLDSQQSGGYHTIYTHSLLDSTAYPALRLTNMINSGSVSEDEELRWTLALHTNARMLLDTYDADLTLVVPGNDGSAFSKGLEESLGVLFEEFNNEYIILDDPLHYEEQAATIVERLLNDNG